MRPRCCLRYLTFFGINIKSALSFQLSALSCWRALLLLPHFWVLGTEYWVLILERARRARFPRGRRFALLRRQNLTFINPALHANHAVRRARLGETVIDIGAQCVQRQPPLQIPLRTRDFVAIQPPAHSHLDAFATEAQRRIHRLAHRPPEAHALFQLQRNRFRHQLRIQLRLVHFLDIDMHFARSLLLQILLQLVDFRALAPDDDPRTRRLDDDPQLVARTLDLDRAHARRLELFLQLGLELIVFEQQLVVVLLDKPARFPRLGVAEPESVRMNLLSHICAPKLFSVVSRRRTRPRERLTTIDQRLFYFFAVAFLPTAFFFAGALALAFAFGLAG